MSAFSLELYQLTVCKVYHDVPATVSVAYAGTTTGRNPPATRGVGRRWSLRRQREETPRHHCSRFAVARRR